MNLSFFQKPSRYIDNEYNSIKHLASAAKNSSGESPPNAKAVRFALSFPDIYEVGMSHLGLKILYDIINNLPYASAERCFSPWTDIEEHMKGKGLLLSSLETGTPLREFDIVGFSLQYELSYTTVLNMLSLAGIPLHSEERLNAKGHLPLVIAGGPCTVNPAPMAPFIDAFLIGDGENAIVELADMIKQLKAAGDGRRESALQEISRLKGFYVPSIHKAESKINRRIIDNLDEAQYPVKTIVPYASIIHDRINIEVSRGCVMGCRFCQAGMIYRPLRERSPETVLRIAEGSIRNTGYDEVSLTSLSAGDYTHLLPVVKEFNRRYSGSKIALSLPSLRVAAVNQNVLREISSIRKTGFTMAPEAATERLRSVINKDFTNDDYEKALKALFEEGWHNLKMYFMIGLPTERDEDIEAIKDMAAHALRVAKKNTGRFVNISITVSPFVPKSHTPFQWCGQISLNEMRRKLRYLKEALSSRKFKYKGHDERMSFLEAVFARGDERLSDLIEKAWASGCRLDGWSEMFDFNAWTDAMDKTGIDGTYYAEKRFDEDERLPWDNIDIGVRKDFLYKEYERAMSEERTSSCLKTCTNCGLKCVSQVQTADSQKMPGVKLPDYQATAESRAIESKVRVRVQFAKKGLLRYLSHLELVTSILRALRRAGIRLDFSKGFHPAPRVSFGPSLSVGVAGEREYFDMEVFTPFDIESYMTDINGAMPEGIRVNKMAVVPVNELSLSNFIRRYEYNVSSDSSQSSVPEKISAVNKRLLNGEGIILQRDGKDVDIAPCIEKVNIIREPGGSDNRLDVGLTLRDNDTIRVRIGEITEAIFGINMRELDITRTAVYGWKDGWVEPI